MTEISGSPLDWTMAVTGIPDNGRDVTRDADPSELTRVAEELGLLACNRIRLRAHVKALQRGRYLITGKISADVVQESVIDRDPIASAITETLATEFWPIEQIPQPDKDEHQILGPDEPEPIVAGLIDIGGLTFETIAAALDPYPRKPDELLGPEGVSAGPQADIPSGPFAKLAAIRKPQSASDEG